MWSRHRDFEFVFYGVGELFDWCDATTQWVSVFSAFLNLLVLRHNYNVPHALDMELLYKNPATGNSGKRTIKQQLNELRQTHTGLYLAYRLMSVTRFLMWL